MRTTMIYLFVLLLSFIVQVNSQTCDSTIPYSDCSTNGACGCFPMSGANKFGICAFLWKFCSQLVPCGSSQKCSDPDHICVQHSRCNQSPVCYPVSMMNENLCPPQLSLTTTTMTTTMPIQVTSTTITTTMSMEVTTTKMKLNKWKQNATTVAGGNGIGSQLNQLNYPKGIFVDQNKNIFIADSPNNRIMKWKSGENEGTIVVGRNGAGNRTDQLNYPTDVIVNEENNSLIIVEHVNRRVIQWFDENQQEILTENIFCNGFAIDKYGFLYVSDWEKTEVRKWKIGEKSDGRSVAGGNGKGYQLNRLDHPTFIFIDNEQSVYISDSYNHRVMKWKKDAKEGVIVAGGNGRGNNLNQLNSPEGLFVDDYGQIYVVDSYNHRIMRWSEGAKEGEIIIGENGPGQNSNQLYLPIDLSFDLEENIYVSDSRNHRIQRFDLIF